MVLLSGLNQTFQDYLLHYQFKPHGYFESSDIKSIKFPIVRFFPTIFNSSGYSGYKYFTVAHICPSCK